MIRRYNYLKIHIKSELETVNSLYELATNSGTLTNYDKIRVQESLKKSPQEKYLYKIIEIENKIDKEKEELISLYNAINSILIMLSEKDSYLIRELDINDKTLDQVADTLKIKSLKYLSNKHYNARKHFRNLQNKLYDFINGEYVEKNGWFF